MVLITGATGHIGNVLVKELLRKKEKIRVFIPEGEDTRPIEGLDVEIVRGDIRDFDAVKEAVKGVDYVYHLAGVISIMPGRDKRLYDINVGGTQNIIEACFKNRVKRLIYTSSIHGMREPEGGVPIDENCPFDPHGVPGFYARTKAEATLEVMRAAERGLDAVIVVPTGVIGPFDYRLSEMGYIIKERAEGNMEFYIDGAYNFVDVRDVVKGIILAKERGKKGEVYILSGERITIKELMKIVDEFMGIKRPMRKVPVGLLKFIAIFSPIYYRLTKKKPLLTPYAIKVLFSNSYVDNSKAKRELGYSPRPLKSSIEDSIKWFMSEKILKR